MQWFWNYLFFFIIEILGSYDSLLLHFAPPPPFGMSMNIDSMFSLTLFWTVLHPRIIAFELTETIAADTNNVSSENFNRLERYSSASVETGDGFERYSSDSIETGDGLER